jgi:hypothetical protein
MPFASGVGSIDFFSSSGQFWLVLVRDLICCYQYLVSAAKNIFYAVVDCWFVQLCGSAAPFHAVLADSASWVTVNDSG